MSAPNFTLGPWAYSVAPCGYIYAITQSANDCIRVETKNEANVRLIAAAPELYHALMGMLDRYVSLVNSGDAGYWNPEEEKKVIEARAVLAKAVQP